MQKKWSRILKKKAWQVAPTVRGSSVQMSRRVEGMITIGGERKGFAHVLIYIQKGLGKHPVLIKDVLKVVAQIQSGAGSYKLHFFAFGYDDEDLKHSVRAMLIRSASTTRTKTKVICKLAGEKSVSNQGMIRRLFPPTGMYSTELHPSSKDLLIFICEHKDSFRLSDKVEKRLSKSRMKRQTFWIYANDCEPEVETQEQRVKRMRLSSQDVTDQKTG